MRRPNFALTVCLLLFAATGLAGLSSCGGGGGSKAPSSPDDQVIITPPANRAPVVIRTFQNITLPVTGQLTSEDLDTRFSDPDGQSLTYTATSSDTNVAVPRISEPGPILNVRLVGAGTAAITVTATDPGGLSVSQSFTAQVTDTTEPPPVDHSDTPSGATPIALGGSFSGRIDSATDVDYFRLPIDEPGTLTITTTGAGDPDIAVFDAAGVEVSGMRGSWIGDILQVHLAKAKYVLVRLFGGNAGQEYSGRTSFLGPPPLPVVNEPPKPRGPSAQSGSLPQLDLTLTVLERDNTDSSFQPPTCEVNYGICEVITSPALNKGVRLEAPLKQFFYDPEGGPLLFRIVCLDCDSRILDSEAVQILPAAATGTGSGHSSPYLNIFPEIDHTFNFQIVAIDSQDARSSLDLRINLKLFRGWKFNELPSLAYNLGETSQTDNAINLRNFITPANPDVMFEVALSGGATARHLSWTTSTNASLSFAAMEQAPPGTYDFTVTARHPNGTSRQRTLSVEVIAAEEAPSTCFSPVSVTGRAESCLRGSGRNWQAVFTATCDRVHTVKYRWEIDADPDPLYDTTHHWVVERGRVESNIPSPCYGPSSIGSPRFKYCVVEGEFGAVNPSTCMLKE